MIPESARPGQPAEVPSAVRFRHNGFFPDPTEERMNLHEYQAKEVFASYGIPVPKGRVAATADEAVAAHQRVAELAWRDALKGAAAAARVRELIRAAG